MPRLLLALLLCLSSCKREREEPRVTVSSTRDATKPIVDDDYRFRLDLPGPGWKLLDEADIGQLVPEALAGAVAMERGVFGAVLVESAPGVELEPMAQLIIDQMPVEGKEILSFEETTLGETPAMAFRLRGKVEDLPLVYAGRILLHADHSYQLVAWRLDGNPKASDSDLDAFFAAFSVTEGEVRGRTLTKGVTSARGVGWRVEDGVFESAVTGMTARPKDGWRVMVGAELTETNPQAEVGLAHAAPDAWIALIAEPAPGLDREELAHMLLEMTRAELEAPPSEEVLEVRFAGADLPLRVLQVSKPIPIEYLHGVHFEGDLAVQVIAWYVSGHREQARAALPAGLGSIAFVDAGARRELAARLETEGDPQSAVGAGWSIRRGAFRDFENGILWRKPRGFWRLAAGQQARAENPDALLSIEAPEQGLGGVLIVEDAAELTAEGYHAAVVAMIEGAATGPERRRLGDATALVSEIAANIDGLPISYRVMTAREGSRAAQLLLWGYTTSMQRHRAVVDAALDGLRFSKRSATTRRAGRYENHLLGFALDEPGPGWRFEDVALPGVGARASFVTWTGRGFIGALSVCALAEGQNEQWFLDFLDQAMRERGFGRGKAEESEVEFAGRTARRLTWKRGSRKIGESYLLVEGCAFHALLLGGTDQRVFDRVRKSYALLD